MVFRCLRARDRGPSKPVEPLPELRPINTSGFTIMLIPGHNVGTSARTFHPNIDEFMLNKKVLRYVMDNYEGKHTLLYKERKKELSYKKAMKDHAKAADIAKAYLAIEFHCNAARVPTARGYEALIKDGDDTSARIAHLFGREFNAFYKIEPRGSYKELRGVRKKRKGDRGFEFMNQMNNKKIGSFIWENCFMDYETNESLKFLGDPERDCEVYGQFIMRTLDKL